MNRINYNKVLKQLISEHPHNIEAIKKVIRDIKENRIMLDLSAQDIVDNYHADWNEDEIYELFKALDINPYEVKVQEPNREYKNEDEQNLFVYLVNNNKKVAFLGALKRMLELDTFRNHGHHTLEQAYNDLIYFIYASKAKFSTKVAYLALLLENTPENILQEQIPTKYAKNYVGVTENRSIFPQIIKSRNLELVKKYAKYLKTAEDFNLYLPYAIENGTTDIVEYFLEQGADPNYAPDDKLKGFLSPLKVAIKDNNLHMYELLKKYGARTNEASRLGESTYATFKVCDKASAKEHDLKVLTSPLEYATVLDDNPVKRQSPLWYVVDFYSGRIEMPYNCKSEAAQNRTLIIDDIYESISDKSTIDYTQLLISTFATRNLAFFKKYADYVLENKIKIDSSNVIKAFYTFKIGEGKNSDEIIDYFLDFLTSYQASTEDLLLNMLEVYFDRRTFEIAHQQITVSSLLTKLLDRVSKNKRLDIPFIAYVKTLDDVKTLEGYGYNINMLDEDGHNILYHLLVDHYKSEDYNKEQCDLIDYLLNNANLSYIDREGHNILYYMLRMFDTQEESRYSKAREHINNVEDITVKIINKMKEEDVIREDNMTIIEGRVITYNSKFGDHIEPELIYQHHEFLFEALIKKNCKFSDNFYASVFSSIYPKENEPLNRELLDKKIDVDNTLRFIFEKLDKNTKVQCLDIRAEYNRIKSYLKRKDATFEEFARLFINFNNYVVELKEFYQENIRNKYNPDRYCEYAEYIYNTTYTDLDDLILSLITSVILKFPEEDIDIILSLCPNYDINHTVEGLSIDYDYETYEASLKEIAPPNDEDHDELSFMPREGRFEASGAGNYLDEEGNIQLYGDLMQFAILINDLDMVKKLLAKNASLEYSYDGDEDSYQYVSSLEMEKFLDSFLEPRKPDALEAADKNYYLSLLGTYGSTN